MLPILTARLPKIISMTVTTTVMNKYHNSKKVHWLHLFTPEPQGPISLLRSLVLLTDLLFIQIFF